MNTKSSSKKSARKSVQVTWKYAEAPVKPATVLSGARKYTKAELKEGPVARAVRNGVKAQPAKSKGKFAIGRKSDPDRERLATADAVRKVLKPKSKSKKGNAVMKTKATKKVVSVSGRKATRGERGERVRVNRKVGREYDEPRFKKEERETAAERLAAKNKRIAAAARMKKTLENYPKNPKIGNRVWEYDGKKGKGKGKKVGKGRRNQAGTAADRKAEAKAARIAAREERKLLKEQAKAERLDARARKVAEREEKKRLRNVPGILFTPAMLKDVMREFINVADTKIGEKRQGRLAKQAERLSAMPLKKIQNRIKNMQTKIKLMEAVMTIGKAALDDGYNKFVEPKTRKGGGKRGGGFGRKAGKAAAADEKPAPTKQAAKTRKAAKTEPARKNRKANGSIALTARQASKSKRDFLAEVGAALAVGSRRSK